MNTKQPDWDKIKDEKADAILKSQCINIAFQGIMQSPARSEINEIVARIKVAKAIYYELKKEDISRW